MCDHIAKHREDKLKIQCAAEYFWQTTKCLEMWWNTVSSIILIETKTKEKTEK